MNPARIAQIRREADDELRTHEWADGVIEELLTAVENLAVAARSAAVLLRSVDERVNTGRPQDVTAIRAAATALDDLTS